MKYIYLLFLIILPFALMAQDSSFDNRGLEVKFDHSLNWEQVKEKAKKENKYIFLDVFASWCAPCKLMDKYVYTNDSVSGVMNDRFINVKVQMDTTGQDDVYTRNWYAVARKLGSMFDVTAYPSFLFFTPSGQLVYKDLGLKSVGDFVRMDSLVLDPKRMELYSLLDNYKGGARDYEVMGDLAVFAKSVLKEKNLSLAIARDYKSSYLDRLSQQDLINRKYFDFIGSFSELVTLHDGIFNLSYHQPDRVDSIIGYKGWASYLVNQTITREKIEAKVTIKEKPCFAKPDWDGIEADINKGFQGVDARQLVLDYKVYYYRNVDLKWREWAKAKEKELIFYPPKKEEEFFSLNIPAWDCFLHCNDKKALEFALKWSAEAISLSQPKPDIQAMDTRANLLYKLGRKRQAISQEMATLDIIKERASVAPRSYKTLVHAYAKTLGDMKDGLPTYLSEGAEWSPSRLPRKIE